MKMQDLIAAGIETQIRLTTIPEDIVFVVKPKSTKEFEIIFSEIMDPKDILHEVDTATALLTVTDDQDTLCFTVHNERQEIGNWILSSADPSKQEVPSPLLQDQIIFCPKDTKAKNNTQ